MKGKNHMIVSKDAEKASNSTSFKIKILRKLGIEKIYLNIIKAIHNKFTGNIILNSEVEESFSATTKSKTRKFSFITFIQHSTGSSSQSKNWTGKGNIRHLNCK